MSYSHISLALGAVVLILAGGFVAIILIDLLFNWFDDIRAWFITQQDKEQGVTRVTCSEAEHVRIDRETQREVDRLAARADRPRLGSVVAPTGTARGPRRVPRGQPTVADKQAAERSLAIQPAPVTGGPGRGDPPKGIAH